MTFLRKKKVRAQVQETYYTGKGVQSPMERNILESLKTLALVICATATVWFVLFFSHLDEIGCTSWAMYSSAILPVMKSVVKITISMSPRLFVGYIILRIILDDSRGHKKNGVTGGITRAPPRAATRVPRRRRPPRAPSDPAAIPATRGASLKSASGVSLDPSAPRARVLHQHI